MTKSKPTAPKPSPWKPANPVYILRTSRADGTAKAPEAKGFKWPKSGYVKAPDWSPSKQCGGGLHGLLSGIGDGQLLDPDCATHLYQVCEAERDEVVDIDGKKVKVPQCNVIYSGDQKGAIAKLAKLGLDISLVACGSASATGDSGSASATGTRGSASATGIRGSASATGYSGSASATGDSGSASATGVKAMAIAEYVCGRNGALLIAKNYDDVKVFAAIGRVGEDGIVADQWYKATSPGILSPCDHPYGFKAGADLDKLAKETS